MLQWVPSAHSVAGGQPQRRHSRQGIAPCSARPALLQLPHRCKIPPSHPSKGPASLPLPGKDLAGGAAPAPPALPAPCSMLPSPAKGVPTLSPTFLGFPPAAAFGVWAMLGFTTTRRGRVAAASLHQLDQAPRNHPATHAFPAAFPFSPYLCRLSQFAAPSELFQSANWC